MSPQISPDQTALIIVQTLNYRRARRSAFLLMTEASCSPSISKAGRHIGEVATPCVVWSYRLHLISSLAVA